MTTWYVYAYDYWGGVTYFKVNSSTLPMACRRNSDALERKLKEIAAKKLGVSVEKTRLGQYDNEPFSQGHLPWSMYKEGKWVSGTVN